MCSVYAGGMGFAELVAGHPVDAHGLAAPVGSQVLALDPRAAALGLADRLAAGKHRMAEHRDPIPGVTLRAGVGHHREAGGEEAVTLDLEAEGEATEHDALLSDRGTGDV